MSKHYAIIKEYYDENLWSKAWVWDAVQKAWLTQEEYTSITGEAYPEVRPK